MKKTKGQIKSFNFKKGMRAGRSYEILEQIGAGWEGEVYLVQEKSTGINCAAKFFFPHRNKKNKTALTYSKKLHKLRNCPIVVKYNSQEVIRVQGHEVTMVVTEFIKGEILNRFLARQRGKKLEPFAALHLLYALASGLEQVHRLKEYHGDIHSENIIVEGFGLNFHIKILDLYYWKAPTRENIDSDICNMIQVFYETLGGKKAYAKLPREIKDIVCGLRSNLILRKFRTAGALKNHLEQMRWRI